MNEWILPHHQSQGLTLYCGDSLKCLKSLPDQMADCVVTSPPYFGLRDYGTEGQYGLEPSPAEYVETMRALFAEARRVLADDGTIWLNLGDSYYSGRGNPGPNSGDQKQPARRGWVRAVDRPGQDWAKPKSLLGIPWRVAFALQDDGWILRNAIVWHKPNAMPSSVGDRFVNKYEMLFMFSKKSRYWFDLDAVRQEVKHPKKQGHTFGGNEKGSRIGASDRTTGSAYAPTGKGKNPGDVWTLSTRPFPEAHFAVMTPDLAERAILSGCRPGGTVLDPFSGSGTTGMVALRNGRRYVGIDLSAEYLDLSLRTRFKDLHSGSDCGTIVL